MARYPAGRRLQRIQSALRTDAHAGFDPGSRLLGACATAFFLLADIEASARRKASGKTPAPISSLALEAVRRIDRLFEIKRDINGSTAEERRAVRQELSKPLVDDLEALLRAERPKLSRGSDLAKAIDYMLKRWPAFTRFLNDGRVCLSKNAAERALRGIAMAESLCTSCSSVWKH